MAKAIQIQIRHLSSLGSQAGVALLLALYLAAFLFPSGSAPHVHSDQTLHEGDSCEKDACHITIYHPGNSAGCHHKFHFTKAPEECLLCHTIVTRHLPLQIILPEELVAASSYFCPSLIVDAIASAEIIHDDRGPPFYFLI